MTRPRLLFIGQSLPYPVDSGAHIRSYHTLRLLATAFDVSALFSYRASARPHQTLSEGLAGVRSVPGVVRAEAVRLPWETSRVRFVSDHLRSAVTGRVYTRFSYDSRETHGLLDEIEASHPPHIVHLDSLDLSAYANRYLGRVPIVCSHHNLESQLLRQRSDLTGPSLRRVYLRFQSSLCRREEQRWIPRLDLNLVVSRKDLGRFEAISPGRYAVVPNCVDTSAFVPVKSQRDGIVFLGGWDWEPNRDAMDYFCREVLPLVRKARPGCRVTWLAKASGETCARLSAQHAIEVVGYVDEIRPFIAGASCYVVPLRVGGGTRLKIIEAWAMGSAVVSTSIGAEGLDARHGENILIAETAEAFAAAVLEVLDNPRLRDRLGRAARETAVRLYDWDGQRDTLVAAYQAILRGYDAGDATAASFRDA